MRRGFSLVELSIVLVIIGLLIGGILVAQSMIGTAKIQRVVRELQQYQIMSDQFGAQYHYFPGDFPNATATFGTACVYNNGSAVNICDGNGDGFIYDGIDGPGQGYRGEAMQFWQHLKLAGFLKDCICDGGGASGDSHAITTTPASSYATGVRWAVGMALNGENYLKAKPNTNYLELTSGDTYDGPLMPGTPIIKPANAAAIDAKIDDGLPYSGEVLGTNWWGALDIYGNCGGLYTYTNNTYQLSYTQDNNGCNMAFELKQNW